MAKSAHTITFRRDIQGLRAVAIALVVLAHAHVPGFAGGFVGSAMLLDTDLAYPGLYAMLPSSGAATHGTAR